METATDVILHFSVAQWTDNPGSFLALIIYIFDWVLYAVSFVANVAAAIAIYFLLDSQKKKDTEIVNLKAEMGKHIHEKEWQRNFLEAQTLQHEEDKKEIEDGVKMTKELGELRNKIKTLKEDKVKLVAQRTIVEEQLKNDVSNEEKTKIQADLKKMQAQLATLEGELKKETQEERIVRARFDQKLTSFDSILHRLITNRDWQREHQDIDDTLYHVYNEDILNSIRAEFVQCVTPQDVIPFFHKYNSKILTERDIEKVRSVTDRGGKFEGATELLSRLVRYRDWFPCLLRVLRDPLVKRENVANAMEALVERARQAPEPAIETDGINMADKGKKRAGNETAENVRQDFKKRQEDEIEKLRKELTKKIEEESRNFAENVRQDFKKRQEDEIEKLRKELTKKIEEERRNFEKALNDELQTIESACRDV